MNNAEIVEITTENIKLDSFLKLAGVVSTGGEAKDIVKSGKVSVNEAVCLQRGKKLVAGNVICVGKTRFYEVRGRENSRA